MAKKISKAAKPAKKAAPAKPTKKAVAKKPVKVASKPAAKPVAKPAAKKTAAKKPVKAAAKPVVKPAAKQPVAKPAAKPVAVKTIAKQPVKASPAAPKPAAKSVAKPSSRKKELNLDALDLDNQSSFDGSSKNDTPYFEAPKAFIKRPDLKDPTPFVGTDTRSRDRDAELAEFKTLLLAKLEDAQRDYELLKSTLSHKDDHGTDDTSPTFKLLEDGSDVMSKEETAVLASRQEKYIQNLQNALVRIENKSYGICRITGKLIPKERLRVVPHATTSMEGKLQQYN